MRHSSLCLLMALMALFCHHASAAQFDNDSISRRPVFITVKPEYGTVFQTNDFFRGDNISKSPVKSFSSVTLALGWQTTGSSDWQLMHRLPSLGIAISTTRFDNYDEIGQPISLFGFYRGVFKRWGDNASSALRYDIDLGLAFNWNYFDKAANPYNEAIGSFATVHVGLGLEYELTLARRFTLGLGANLTHFSNGAVRKPNKGANLFSPFVRLSYFLNPYQPRVVTPDFGRLKAYEVQLTTAFGFKRVEHNLVAHPTLDSKYQDDPVFYIYTLKAAFLHQYSYKGKFGGGISLCYDQWFGSDIAVSPDLKITKDLSRCPGKPNVGLFITHEFLIHRFAILTDLGSYIYQPPTPWDEQIKDNIFERLGAKFYLPLNLFTGVNVYAHNSKADFVEWCLGYSFRWNQHTKY